MEKVKMPDGLKHLISCHCVLPQFRRRPDPIFHKFIVFSVLNDDDNVIPKLAKCNNCAVVHRVIDICKSEFIHNQDDSDAIMTEADIKLMLPQKIIDILESYNVDLPIWEQAQFIIENQKWNNFIILTSETFENKVEGKILRILGETFYKIEVFTREEMIDVINNNKVSRPV
jgi:hypothetical protein